MAAILACAARNNIGVALAPASLWRGENIIVKRKQKRHGALKNGVAYRVRYSLSRQAAKVVTAAFVISFLLFSHVSSS